MRHGKTHWNSEGRFQGNSDIDLSLEGRGQAKALAVALKNLDMQFMYSSDSTRAINTALEIGHFHPNANYEKNADLREMNFGVWEGLTQKEIVDKFPGDYAKWAANKNYPPLNGEPFDAFVLRLKRVYTQLLARHTLESGVIVGHGGSLRVIICMALGISPEYRWRMDMEPGSVSKIEINKDASRLCFVNYTGHLEHPRKLL